MAKNTRVNLSENIPLNVRELMKDDSTGYTWPDIGGNRDYFRARAGEESYATKPKDNSGLWTRYRRTGYYPSYGPSQRGHKLKKGGKMCGCPSMMRKGGKMCFKCGGKLPMYQIGGDISGSLFGTHNIAAPSEVPMVGISPVGFTATDASRAKPSKPATQKDIKKWIKEEGTTTNAAGQSIKSDPIIAVNSLEEQAAAGVPGAQGKLDILTQTTGISKHLKSSWIYRYCLSRRTWLV